jgi:hypothetical protein
LELRKKFLNLWNYWAPCNSQEGELLSCLCLLVSRRKYQKGIVSGYSGTPDFDFEPVTSIFSRTPVLECLSFLTPRQYF